jgi:hypothetical protein
MTFRVTRFSRRWSGPVLLLMMLRVLVNTMNFPGHRAMAFMAGAYTKLPVKFFFLGGESATTAARRRSSPVQRLLLSQQSPAPPRTFHTIAAAKASTTSRLLTYPPQRMSYSSSNDDDDDSVPKDIYIPEDQLDFSFVRASVCISSIFSPFCALMGI